MLVERGVRVMNTGVVGDAYAIAANYLRRTGAISDDFVTNDHLLAIIVQMFHRGEGNKLRLANRAIAQFQAHAMFSSPERSPSRAGGAANKCTPTGYAWHSGRTLCRPN